MDRIINLFRFKKLDRYILGSYIGPFFLIFFISWFITIMQFLWKYIDDLIGKGVELSLILKMIFYNSLLLIPMAMPITILLTSIMVLGKYGENFELTAAKASGVSLLRFYKSLIFYSIFIAIGSFYFANFVLTKVDMIAKSMLVELRNLKPALLIKPKTFYNGIGGVTIRIEDKNEKTGELKNIMIYDHTEGKTNESILIAKRAYIQQSASKNILILKLDSGTVYKEQSGNSFQDIKYPFYKTTFSKWEKRFDLKQFKLDEKFGKNFEDKRFMLSTSGLSTAIKGFEKEINENNVKFFKDFFQNKTKFNNLFNSDSFLKTLNPKEKAHLVDLNTTIITRNKSSLGLHYSNIEYLSNVSNLYTIEIYFKYIFAFASVVLFFVGASLGSIIKKGGLGWPMFYSVILFIIYYMGNILFKKACETGMVNSVFIMWIPTLVFAFLALILTVLAKNDIKLSFPFKIPFLKK